MAHRTDDTCNTRSVSLQDSLLGAIGSWLHARREKYAKNRDILQILSHDARLLNDIGFSREQLVGELGYDPCELPELFSGGGYRTPRL
ncbi:DUF1127 domain-containing protein [Anderseniella sp. Alg231-50]|uniref:DUF1127 domain-containing protein n=1 Tax=Anderseniella sp. Alg231-50 TaxID=1922226 RepID=UPI000D555435